MLCLDLDTYINIVPRLVGQLVELLCLLGLEMREEQLMIINDSRKGEETKLEGIQQPEPE